MTARSFAGSGRIEAPLPVGLTLIRLTDSPTDSHELARQFCLETIKEFYGFDYRLEWHLDLDSLLSPAEKNHYSPLNRGAFWLLLDRHGEIQATAGIRHLGWKPGVVSMFPDRYPKGERIASLWRVYVRREARGQGLGRWLTRLSEGEAVRMGYDCMYLHASADATPVLAFWRAVGYRQIGVCETSVHFDKQIAAAEQPYRDAFA